MKTQTESELFAALARVDTPTICNALEVVNGERADSGFTRRTMVAALPEAPAFIGRARTATIRAARRAGAPAGIERRMEYFRYIAGGGHGDKRDGGPKAAGGANTVVVIEDLDQPPGIGAFWGEVHSAVHAALGVAGVVTNGAVRDLGQLHPRLPILAGAVTPSHAFVDTEELDTAVTVFGMAVAPGDIIHADRHGAVVIADAALAELPAAVESVARREAVILAAARAASPGELGIKDLETALRKSREA